MNIFLAGAEKREWALLLNWLRYPHRLLSYFQLRSSASDAKVSLKLACDQSPSCDWILDSGLFSFMFGSSKGVLRTYEDYKRYAETYLEDVLRWDYPHRLVECDVQRVLGVAECERLRDEVFRPSGLPVIYVWHAPEGPEGLRRLAAREKHIALSIPELRMISEQAGPPKRVLIELFRIIRSSGGNPSVHLLGNTEMALMGLPGDSCDSSSWIASGKYGDGQMFCFDSRTLRKVSIYSPKWRAWQAYCEAQHPEAFANIHRTWPEPARYQYYAVVACNAISYLFFMEARYGQSQRAELRPDPNS